LNQVRHAIDIYTIKLCLRSPPDHTGAVDDRISPFHKPREPARVSQVAFHPDEIALGRAGPVSFRPDQCSNGPPGASKPSCHNTADKTGRPCQGHHTGHLNRRITKTEFIN
jgi:hypothetical protein